MRVEEDVGADAVAVELAAVAVAVAVVVVVVESKISGGRTAVAIARRTKKR